MGATDIGVGKRVKEMAKGFYGRIKAYEDGLAGDDAVLAEALRRNLYGNAAPEAVTAMGPLSAPSGRGSGPTTDQNFFENDIKFAPISL